VLPLPVLTQKAVTRLSRSSIRRPTHVKRGSSSVASGAAARRWGSIADGTQKSGLSSGLAGRTPLPRYVRCRPSSWFDDGFGGFGVGTSGACGDGGDPNAGVMCHRPVGFVFAVVAAFALGAAIVVGGDPEVVPVVEVVEVAALGGAGRWQRARVACPPGCSVTRSWALGDLRGVSCAQPPRSGVSR
jgi:hypothetical protein